MGIPGSIRPTPATWAPEKPSEKDTRGRTLALCIHRHTRSSAHPRPSQPGAGPAPRGGHLYLLTCCAGSLPPSTCVRLPIIIPGTWATGPAHSPAGGSFCRPITPGPGLAGPSPWRWLPAPHFQGLPSPTPACQLIPGLRPTAIPHLSPPLPTSPVATSPVSSEVGSQFSLSAGRELPSSSPDPKGLSLPCDRGLGAALHSPAGGPHTWSQSPGGVGPDPELLGLRHQLRRGRLPWVGWGGKELAGSPWGADYSLGAAHQPNQRPNQSPHRGPALHPVVRSC